MNPGDVWVFKSLSNNDEVCFRVIDDRTGKYIAVTLLEAEAIAISKLPQLVLALIHFARLPVSKDGSCHTGLLQPEQCSRCGPILRARQALNDTMPGRLVWPPDGVSGLQIDPFEPCEQQDCCRRKGHTGDHDDLPF